MRPVPWLIAATFALGATPGFALALNGHVEARSFVGPVTGQMVSFNVYLPPGYERGSDRYPVIYHLHGIGGAAGGPQVNSVPASFEAAAAQGIIGPVIIVFPNGYTDSWWADSIDGDKPAETDVVKQLIPYVDAAFRTIAAPGARVMQGFSMGGFGATKFYAKFPELFAACVEYDGAMVNWPNMLQFHAALARSIFGGSEKYFDQHSPWHWTSVNAGVLDDGPPIRMVVGSLVPGNQNFRNHLIREGIGVDYVTTGCGHELGCLLSAQGLASAAFIASHLDLTTGTPGPPSDLNGDGLVDGVDLGILLSQWSILGGSSADLNEDNAVNGIDLGILLAHWTF